MSNHDEKLLNWLEKQKRNDAIELERSKQKYIQQIKKEKNLIPKPEKITLWKRIKKVLIGY